MPAEDGPDWRFRGTPPALERVAGDWHLRVVQPYRATKLYRCPGCDQEIPPGVPHVVAWPADAQPFGINMGVGERRHWHRACWQRRMHRRPAR